MLAIELRAAWPKRTLGRLLRQPSEASGPYVEGCILSQTHFLWNLAQFKGILVPDYYMLKDGCTRNAKPRSPMKLGEHCHVEAATQIVRSNARRTDGVHINNVI